METRQIWRFSDIRHWNATRGEDLMWLRETGGQKFLSIGESLKQHIIQDR